MKRIVVSALVASILTSGATAHAVVQTTSPGKNSAYASNSFIALPTYPATLATVTIEKGKKKRVLEVIGMVSSTSGAPVKLAGEIVVNGILLPQSAGWTTAHDCPGTPVGCNLTSSFWLDIDAAELASPGTFVGQPLIVDWIGGAYTGVGAGANSAVSLSVRMEKK